MAGTYKGSPEYSKGSTGTGYSKVLNGVDDEYFVKGGGGSGVWSASPIRGSSAVTAPISRVSSSILDAAMRPESALGLLLKPESSGGTKKEIGSLRRIEAITSTCKAIPRTFQTLPEMSSQDDVHGYDILARIAKRHSDKHGNAWRGSRASLSPPEVITLTLTLISSPSPEVQPASVLA
jgi:hypothetical protein